MSFLKRLLDIILAPPSEPKPDDVVPAGFPDGEAVGEFWVSKLNAEGLWAELRDVSPLYRGYLNWAGKYEVRVRYGDIERARQIFDLDENGVPRASETVRPR